jgi:16S rRNA (uracil1498-N3)-methyltransferase
MRVPRIFTSLDIESGIEVELDEAASRHVITVLRMETGRPLILFDGSGGEFQAELVATTKKKATVRVDEYQEIERESPLHTHLAVGISRGERFDFVLQKATELGVSRITPLFTSRCEVKLQGERLEKRVHSWQRIIQAACEQCNRNTLPQLDRPQRITDFQSDSDLKLVLHHRASQALKDFAAPENVCLLIGPEGGLAASEIEAAQVQGYKPLVLGPRVMRTETAPIVALANLQLLWGDF